MKLKLRSGTHHQHFSSLFTTELYSAFLCHINATSLSEAPHGHFQYPSQRIQCRDTFGHRLRNCTSRWTRTRCTDQQDHNLSLRFWGQRTPVKLIWRSNGWAHTPPVSSDYHSVCWPEKSMVVLSRRRDRILSRWLRAKKRSSQRTRASGSLR